MEDYKTIKRGALRGALGEPLVQFLIVGALLFGAHSWVGGGTDIDSNVIEVPQAMVKGVRDEHLLRTGQPATRADLEAAVRNYVESEALYREARRWGLDESDPIVRRRLVQKMRFVVEDSAQSETPTAESLRAFFEADPERFTLPARTSFDHVFLADDNHDDLEALAKATLEKLNADDSRWRTLGDGFVWGASFESVTDDRLADMIGEEAGEQITTLEVRPDAWQGPVTSPFGLHLIRVRGRTPARVPSFEEARAEVYNTFITDERERSRKAALDELIESYEIEVEYPEIQVAELEQ